jgi:hypothetical protein
MTHDHMDNCLLELMNMSIFANEYRVANVKNVILRTKLIAHKYAYYTCTNSTPSLETSHWNYFCFFFAFSLSVTTAIKAAIRMSAITSTEHGRMIANRLSKKKSCRCYSGPSN